jgi:hypothetical protein
MTSDLVRPDDLQMVTCCCTGWGWVGGWLVEFRELRPAGPMQYKSPLLQALQANLMVYTHVLSRGEQGFAVRRTACQGGGPGGLCQSIARAPWWTRCLRRV